MPYMSVWRFRDLSSTARNPNFLNSWPLKMRPICRPETPVRNHHYKWHNSPEWRSIQHRCFIAFNLEKVFAIHKYTCNLFDATNILKFILFYMFILAVYLYLSGGTAVGQWLRRCATNRKVTGSIPAGVTGIFRWHKSLPITLWCGIDSASNWNVYQELFLGVKAAGA